MFGATAVVPSYTYNNSKWQSFFSGDLKKLKSFYVDEASFRELTAGHTNPNADKSEWFMVFDFHVAIFKAVKKSLVSGHHELDLKEIVKLVSSGKVPADVFKVIAKTVEAEYEVKPGKKSNPETYNVKTEIKGKKAVEKALMLYATLGNSALENMIPIRERINTLKQKISKFENADQGKDDDWGFDRQEDINQRSQEISKLEDLQKLVVIVEHAFKVLSAELKKL
ncbi:hypothetical protein Ddc_23215 [Ditylenchus destructor]|nr:hypothetical protein Ddc_23215 [Ditylenchus destructor]